MKYFVRMAVVDARFECEVEAESLASAREAAHENFRDADMGDLCVDDVRGKIVYIQDESGNFLEEGGAIYENSRS